MTFLYDLLICFNSTSSFPSDGEAHRYSIFYIKGQVVVSKRAFDN